MLSTSLLGWVYRVWLDSRVLHFFRSIYLPFKSAFYSSGLVRFFGRVGAADRWYEGSLIGRCIDAVISAVSRLLGRLWLWVVQTAESGFVIRFVRRFFLSSRLCSFEFLFSAFVCVMFIAPHSLWSNTYALLASAAFLGLHLIMSGARKRRLTPFTSLGLPVLLFALACCLGVVFSFDRSDSLRVLFFFITAVLLCWTVVSDFTDTHRLMQLMGFIYAAVLLTSLYAIVQRVMGVAVSASFTDLSANAGVPGRVYSTLDNPNNFAEFIVLFTPLCAAFVMNLKDARWRFFLGCGIVFPFLALLMTYSRSGWISMLLAIVVFVWFSEKKLLPVLVFIGFAAIPFLPDSIITRILSLFGGNDSSASHRVYIWQGVGSLLKDYLPAGIGLGPVSFDIIYDDYAVPKATLGVVHSHMVYMELLVETGVLGFIAFMWYYLRTIRDGVYCLAFGANGQLRAIVTASTASLIGIAFSFAVEYVWYYPRVLFAFFLLCGISMAAVRAAGNYKAR